MRVNFLSVRGRRMSSTICQAAGSPARLRMLTHPVLPTPTPMQVVRRLHFETGYYSRCWEISSAHLDAEAHRFLAELADIATPTLFLFVAFRIPYSPAIGLKLIATPWTDENLRAVEGITAKRLMQEHRKKGMPESLVHALHLAALADVRMLVFDADAQVLDGLPIYDE